MAKRRGSLAYPIQVDTEDVKFRMYVAMHVAGLTVRDVADYMNARVQYVTGAIDGRDYHLTVQFLTNFCAICGCSIADILPFANDVLPIPYDFAVLGSGAAPQISPDPYRITFSEPETLGNAEWSKAPQNEV